MIKDYHFGSITIDDRTYTHDVEVRWTEEVLGWRRKESHLIDVGDIRRAVEGDPETIIIGTGETGVAQVTSEAQKFIREKGIKLIIDLTEPAIKNFNLMKERTEKGDQKKVIGLFHLTC